MGRPCPKCGGAVYVHEEDKDAAIIYAVVALGIMVVFGLVMVALGGAKL